MFDLLDVAPLFKVTLIILFYVEMSVSILFKGIFALF